MIELYIAVYFLGMFLASVLCRILLDGPEDIWLLAGAAIIWPLVLPIIGGIAVGTWLEGLRG